MTSSITMPSPLSPPPLATGDTIGIIAPAAQIHDRKRFETGIRILQEMGFQVRFPPSLWPGAGYFADTDAGRADEFNRMWGDPEIRALMAARGGYGCLRILDRIDLHQVRQTPKLLIGFSDLTVLHAFLQQETGLISLHGPVLTSLAGVSRPAFERFQHCLRGNWRHPIAWNVEVLRSGAPRQGVLAGGNLSSIVSLLGTPFEPVWTDRIVFLEDTNEPLYRIDRMLTQLFHAGKFNDAAGVILGDFSQASHDSLEKIRHHETIWNRTLAVTQHAGVPVWGGFPIGHGPDNLALPIGSPAVMDSDTAALQFV